MWGISFCFAHNGDVSCFDRKQFASNEVIDCPSTNAPKVNQINKSCVQIPWIGKSIGVDDTGERHYNTIGATDSEAMFCAILNALRARFDTLPTLPVLHSAVQSLCNEIVCLDDPYEGTTIFNFLLGCGPHIQFAYSCPELERVPRYGMVCIIWYENHPLVKPIYQIAITVSTLQQLRRKMIEWLSLPRRH